MTSYADAFEAAKSIETALSALGATGRGIHEKVNSVTHLLSALQIRGLRAIATIRNKLAHEEGFAESDIAPDYHQLVEELLDALAKIAVPRTEEVSRTDQIAAFLLEQCVTAKCTSDEPDFEISYRGLEIQLFGSKESPTSWQFCVFGLPEVTQDDESVVLKAILDVQSDSDHVKFVRLEDNSLCCCMEPEYESVAFLLSQIRTNLDLLVDAVEDWTERIRRPSQ